MKSLKNKKCKCCGKPAEIWLPVDEDIEEPYCIKCAESQTILDTFESDDDDED